MKIAGFVNEEGKPSVIAVNKWDLVEKDTYTVNDFKKRIYTELAFMPYVQVAFISAKTGQRTDKLLEMAESAYCQQHEAHRHGRFERLHRGGGARDGAAPRTKAGG